MTGTDESSLAVHYDELPLWSALAGRLLLDHLPLPSRGRILDIGCGTGFPSLELAARCGGSVEVVGVDMWEAALAHAEIKAIAWHCGNATFVHANAIDLPLPDASFDLVVSCLGLNNFADPERALAEAARVLAPGGRLGLVTNLRGQFRALYDVLAHLARMRDDAGALARIEAQEAGRTTIDGLRGIAARAVLATRPGARSWRYKYRFAGKEKLLVIGRHPDVSLKAARLARDEAKGALAKGRDPSLERRRVKLVGQGRAEETFEKWARDWFDQQKSRWKPVHADDVITSMIATCSR